MFSNDSLAPDASHDAVDDAELNIVSGRSRLNSTGARDFGDFLVTDPCKLE